MVDIHCHILPAVDDGSESWEESIDMCRMAAEDGITHVVATPHANDEYQFDRPRYQAILDELQGRIGGMPQLILGCDFHLSYENVQDALANPGRYNIGNTRYMLIELSEFSVTPQVDHMIYSLVSGGSVPILTHPERNQLLQRAPERVAEWVRMGTVVQVTASSFLGKWGKPALKTARLLMERELVHVVASDAHGTTSRRPNLSQAREFLTKNYGDEIAMALVEDNPRAIVENQ